MQSFRQFAWGLRQLVLKPGFRPKGRALGMKEKSENFNSLRPILFESCKKKLQGGVKLTHPPSTNRVKAFKMFVLRLYEDEVLQTQGNTEIRLSRSPESTVSELIIRQIHSNRSIIQSFTILLNYGGKRKYQYNKDDFRFKFWFWLSF